MRVQVVVLLVLCSALAAAKVFTKCELAEVLETVHHMKRDEAKIWTCIAQYESTFNASAINHFNWDGSKDYGLFQLNNKYWCGADYAKNECQIPCSALLDSDLTDDLRCIKKIIRDTEAWQGKGTGLLAWVAYVKRCQNRNLDQYMSECWEASNIIEIKDNRPTDNPSSTTTTTTDNPPSTTTTTDKPPSTTTTTDNPPSTTTTTELPGTIEVHVPIINNARVPIRYKVVSYMHPPYIPVPFLPPLFIVNPYSFIVN